MSKEKIGLIAGRGELPILMARAAKAHGVSVVAVAFKGDTSVRLKNFVTKIHWIKVEDFVKIPSLFKACGISKVVMIGQVNPSNLFKPAVLANKEVKSLLETIEDRRAETIFKAFIGHLAQCGIQFLDSSVYLKDYLPGRGELKGRQPTLREWEDVYFGFRIAKAMAHLDIGQTVCVKDKSVIAVEALEGTDATIQRAGEISGKGFVVVKVARPLQDMRFDIPVVGPQTFKITIAAGASCLALEADKTLLIDRERCERTALKEGLALAAV